MAPKQRQSKRNEKSAPSAAAPSDGSSAGPQGPEQVAAPAGGASFLTLYLFGFSFLMRSIGVPYYGTFIVTGMLSRWSYPSEYTAPGVTCTVEALDGPKFCEHEILFEDQGVALLSCDPGRGEWNTVMGPLLSPDPRGKLWLYDYGNTKKSKEIQLDGFPAEADFHPLGMNYYSDAAKNSLFVINHQRTGPTIETFSLDPSKGMSISSVTYEKTIAAHPDIKSANSVVAMDHDHLYVTNDHAWPRLESGEIWANVEVYAATMYPQTFITHVDLTGLEPSFTRAFKGLKFANGLAVGSNRTLYAASSVAGTVSILSPINATNPVLVQSSELNFGYSLDNVYVSKGITPAQDVIVVGGHPNTMALAKKAKSPHASIQSPSWLSFARLRQPAGDRALGKPEGWHEPRANAKWVTRTVYEDDGAHFSSATGAGVDFKRDILISPGLYETGLLVCRDIKNVL